VSEQQDRIEGALWGLAWGDVLGCPIESWRSAEIEQVYGGYDDLPHEYPFERIAPLGLKRLKRLRPLGLYSDDTQQCLALLHVCLAEGGWSAQPWAGLLVEGRSRKAWRGTGRNFSAALSRLARGVPPESAANPTAGIGAVMRIGAVGALLRDDEEQLARVTFEASLTTHGDLRSGATAFAVARAVADLVQGRAAAEVLQSLPRRVREQERVWIEGRPEWQVERSAGHQVSDCLAAIVADFPSSPAALAVRVAEVARPHLPPGHTVGNPNQGFVLLGGLHALLVGLGPWEGPAALLAGLVRHGYDTDTVAAICGSLLGARFGTSWVPRERLHDRERLGEYARALVERRSAPEPRNAFLRREAELTETEDRFQEDVVRRHALLAD
jgi:ADP-ribosylglycohydrolase